MPQAGLLASSCSSWCLVFLGGRRGSTRGRASSGCCWTKSMVAMGTGLDGTGILSANMVLSGEKVRFESLWSVFHALNKHRNGRASPRAPTECVAASSRGWVPGCSSEDSLLLSWGSPS